jgi:hypothetical protein
LKILKFGGGGDGLYYENIDFLFCYFGPLLTTKTQKEKEKNNNNNNLTHTRTSHRDMDALSCLKKQKEEINL